MTKTLMLEKETEGLFRTPTKDAVVLFSGGADCTASALRMIERGFGIHMYHITFDQYNAAVELRAAKAIYKKLREFYPHSVKTFFNLNAGGILADSDWAIGDRDAFIPFRNTLFMTLGAAYAVKHDADGIVIGMMKDDIGVFGDNDQTHHQLLEVVFTKAISRRMKVYYPLITYSKKQIKELLEIAGLWGLTVSCWNAKIDDDDIIVVCGQCAQCIERGGL